MRRIAIVGASGFVGSTLVERLLAQAQDEVLPLIHSSGNAWRLARLGIDLPAVDLLVRDEIERALQGCTHVVNCALGRADAMVKGLQNLLAASQKNKVERFIHLSSVLVYGDPPPIESVHEDAQTHPVKGTYGWLKLQQDRMVLQACRAGLPSVILCPPNISGAYSPYLVRVLDALRAGAFALLDDGKTPCNLVDVSNLAHAIELALDSGGADGKRMFITDDEETTWHDVIAGLTPVAERIDPVPIISREELLRLRLADSRPSLSVVQSLKHLVSGDVRAAMRQDPLWAKVEQALGQGVTRLGKVVEERLRLSIAGPPPIPKVQRGPQYNAQLCIQQLRGVRHASDLAKQELGYKPLYTFAASMRAFCSWYRSQHGMDTGSWDLLKQLYMHGEQDNDGS
jgi:nucleoside-diphosphate-sugar epimerase